ncbi:MAG: hypothetical protein GDA37_08140 [Ekhidna sp.]|nr:hypothetical protein [Ekhidna sp.]
MNTIKIFASVTLLMSFTILSAQDKWNWGNQVDVAKEKNVLYTDAKKTKNYEDAVEPLNWLLENTPDLNPSIYINGVEIYKELAKKESDPVKKEEYIQTGLELHDKRIKYFKQENSVTLRKAYFAYGFYNKTKEKYPLLYELFTKAFELQKEKMPHSALVAYMNSVYKYRFGGGNLSDPEVIDIYFRITDAIAAQKKDASDENKAKMNKSLDTIDRLLLATKVNISCDFVEENLGPKLEKGKDENIAKKIFKLMLDGKCLDRDLALKAAKIIQENEPTFAVAKLIAQKNAQNGDNEAAIKFFEEALTLTDDNTEKADAYLSIAKIQSKNGQKSASRGSARRALSFDPSFSDAYNHIGNLYMGSFNDCKQEQSQVDDRLVFIAAYNEYKKAGNTAKMAKAKEQFPSISDIFTEGKEEGQSVTVGCWINTTVTLERRPESK